MLGFTEAVWRRVAYGPRFLRHYRHRRGGGYGRSHAFRGTRERMRQYKI